MYFGQCMLRCMYVVINGVICMTLIVFRTAASSVPLKIGDDDRYLFGTVLAAVLRRTCACVEFVGGSGYC